MKFEINIRETVELVTIKQSCILQQSIYLFIYLFIYLVIYLYIDNQLTAPTSLIINSISKDVFRGLSNI